jgi:hypothetical protein
MARILLHGDSGVDYVWSDDTDRPGVTEVIQMIKDRVQLAGSHVTLAVRASLTGVQRQEVLRAFPGYKRCVQETKGLIMLDCVSDD